MRFLECLAASAGVEEKARVKTLPKGLVDMAVGGGGGGSAGATGSEADGGSKVRGDGGGGGSV